MKLSDYIVQFLIDKGVKDCFGYPGGSVTNFLDSIRKREEIDAHVTYHEQGAAFAACGYAQASGNIGVAYATGGPGCTNLLTGMGQAFYDSIPVIFFTGNVNTYESKGNMGIRQRGFQESDNVAAARPFTKYAVYVEKPEKIRYYLEKAFSIATSGRKGPVLLDLPMDIQRSQIDPDALEGYLPSTVDTSESTSFFEECQKEIGAAKRPCLILGKGVCGYEARNLAKSIIENWNIPYVTSMISFDILGAHPNYFGFLGAYGIRSANFIAAKSDLIISIGSRLDIRQVGAKRENFAPSAKLIRVDIDKDELQYKVHEDEMGFAIDSRDALKELMRVSINRDYSGWISVCRKIRDKLKGIDDNIPNKFISSLSSITPADTIITTDVGQNQVWVAQSFVLKNGQEVYFSGGFGSMGHALPAAIGACYGNKNKNILCICGDGGLQMNIQELQYIVRENLPVKIIVFNNNALGMIRHFQEMYFESVYYQTKPEGGYLAPDFTKIAGAYGIKAIAIDSIDDVYKCKAVIEDEEPVLIEIRYFENTYITPKLKFGNANQDQEPLIDRGLYNSLMEL